LPIGSDQGALGITHPRTVVIYRP